MSTRWVREGSTEHEERYTGQYNAETPDGWQRTGSYRATDGEARRARAEEEAEAARRRNRDWHDEQQRQVHLRSRRDNANSSGSQSKGGSCPSSKQGVTLTARSSDVGPLILLILIPVGLLLYYPLLLLFAILNGLYHILRMTITHHLGLLVLCGCAVLILQSLRVDWERSMGPAVVEERAQQLRKRYARLGVAVILLVLFPFALGFHKYFVNPPTSILVERLMSPFWANEEQLARRGGEAVPGVRELIASETALWSLKATDWEPGSFFRSKSAERSPLAPAFRVLGRIGEPGLEALREYLKGESEYIQALAVFGIGEAGPSAKSEIPHLVNVQKWGSGLGRAEVVRALQKIEPTSSLLVELAEGAMTDPHWMVRRNAVQAFVRMVPHNENFAVRGLKGTIADVDRDVRLEAVTQIAQLGPLRADLVSALGRQLRDEGEWDIQRKILSYLEALGSVAEPVGGDLASFAWAHRGEHQGKRAAGILLKLGGEHRAQGEAVLKATAQ